MSHNEKPSIKGLGLWMCIALVVGNMVGSGIFSLPASLAPYGGISIIGWLYTAAGAMILAFIFARLSRLIPKAGGPYTFTREGFGDFPGFLVAWGYWISIWAGNAAITISMIGYSKTLFPFLNSSPIIQILFGLSIIWILTLINIMGIRKAGITQVITTILKLTPLFFIAIIGIFYLNPEHFIPFNRSGSSSFSAITATAALTLWAFLGLESASIPSDNIQNPKKTIPKATIIGTLFTALLYIMGTVAVMGILPPVLLAKSTAPFAEAAIKIWGNWAGYLVAAGAAISCIGALNGWILLQGQIPKAIAIDGLFPKIFAKVSKNRTPVVGLIFSSALITGLILMNYTKGLVEQFTFIIMLATLTCLIPYIFCSISELIIYLKNPKKINKGKLISTSILSFLGLSYSIWALTGLNRETFFWGCILLIAGIPVYVWVKITNKKTKRIPG